MILYRLNLVSNIKQSRFLLKRKHLLISKNNKLLPITKTNFLINKMQLFVLVNKAQLRLQLLHRLKSKKLFALHPTWLYFSYSLMLGFLLSLRTFNYPYNHTKTISGFIGSARYF